MGEFERVGRASFNRKIDDLIGSVDCSKQTIREAKMFRTVGYPVVRASGFYRDIGKYVDDDTWAELRESIVDMMDLEDKIMSDRFILREDDSMRSLLEDYDRALSFKTPLSVLRERGYDDLSSDDKALYDKYKGEEGAFRKKDSYKQRMAKLRKLDAERNRGREDLPEPKSDAGKIPTEAEKKVDAAIHDLEMEAQETGDPGEKKAALKKAGGLFAKLRDKFGETAIGKYLKSHPQVANAIKKIATNAITIGAGAIGGTIKYSVLFAPLGPLAPVAGAALGILIAYAAKAAGKLGAKAGKILGQKLVGFINEKAKTCKVPVLKRVLAKLATPAGNKVIQIVVTMALAITAGGAVALGANSVVTQYGPQLVASFQAMFQSSPEIAQTVAAAGDTSVVAAEVAAETKEVVNNVAPEMVKEIVPDAAPAQAMAQADKVVAQAAIKEPDPDIKELFDEVLEASPSSTVDPGAVVDSGSIADAGEPADVVDSFLNDGGPGAIADNPVTPEEAIAEIPIEPGPVDPGDAEAIAELPPQEVQEVQEIQAVASEPENLTRGMDRYGAANFEPNGMDQAMQGHGFTRVALEGHEDLAAWSRINPNGSRQVFVDMDGSGVFSPGDAMYTSYPDGTQVVEMIGADGNMVEVSRSGGSAANAGADAVARGGGEMPVPPGAAVELDSINQNIANMDLTNNPALKTTAAGNTYLSGNTAAEIRGLKSIPGLENANIRNTNGILRITLPGSPQQYTIMGTKLYPVS